MSKDETTEEKNVIFVAKARGYDLGNFIPEVKVGGVIDVSEQSIKFINHLHVTSDEKEIKYIRESDAFKTKNIREMAGMKDANSYIRAIEADFAGQQAGKVETTYTEKTEYKDKPVEEIARNNAGIK